MRSLDLTWIEQSPTIFFANVLLAEAIMASPSHDDPDLRTPWRSWKGEAFAKNGKALNRPHWILVIAATIKAVLIVLITGTACQVVW